MVGFYYKWLRSKVYHIYQTCTKEISCNKLITCIRPLAASDNTAAKEVYETWRQDTLSFGEHVVCCSAVRFRFQPHIVSDNSRIETQHDVVQMIALATVYIAGPRTK